MSLQFEISSGGCVPEGVYRAKFVDVEKTEHDEFGDGLKFVFKVVEGNHVGESATRITGAKPTVKNAAGKMISGITGQSLTPGSNVDLASCVGREYLVQVETTKNDSTRIASVMSIPS